MSRIQNIPENMIEKHVNWHTRPGDSDNGGRSIDPWLSGSIDPTPGSGEEFLVWHHGYIQRFYEWVETLPVTERPDEAEIAAWKDIPVGLKMGMVGWNQQRARDVALLRDMSNFATIDDLGRFLEWGLHGWLHGASASMWNEPVLRSYESPKSTYFWQLHGLIDYWRQQWVETHMCDSKIKLNASINQKEQPNGIYVHGSVMVYTSETEVSISRAKPQGINKSILLLNLTVTKKPGPMKGIPREFSYEEHGDEVNSYKQVHVISNIGHDCIADVKVFG